MLRALFRRAAIVLVASAAGFATFITYLVPTTLIFIPLASVVNKLGLSNTIWALVVTYVRD